MRRTTQMCRIKKGECFVLNKHLYVMADPHRKWPHPKQIGTVKNGIVTFADCMAEDEFPGNTPVQRVQVFVQ